MTAKEMFEKAGYRKSGKNYYTKDNTLATTLKGENDSLSNSVKLKQMLNIPDNLFIKYIEQVLRGDKCE